MTLVVVPVRAEVAVAASVFVTAGEPAVAPLAPVTVAKPVAQTAPVPRPTTPKTIHAMSRRRDRPAKCEEGLLDMASLPFVVGSVPAVEVC